MRRLLLPALCLAACASQAARAPASRPAAGDQVPFGPDEREAELAFLRDALRDTYAHLEVKRAQLGVNPDVLFTRFREAIRAADTWARYERVMVAYVSAFHDGHLVWRRHRETPERRRRIVRLGLDTQWAGEALVVSEVWPGSAAEKAGVRVGDHVTSVNGESMERRFADHASVRSWSREAAERWDFAHEWPAWHVFVDEPTRGRRLELTRVDGAVETLEVAPETAPRASRPAAASLDERDGVLVLAVRTLGKRAELGPPLEELHRRLAAGAGAVVVNLRGNAGGYEAAALDVAAPLVVGPAHAGDRRVRLSPAARAAHRQWRDLAEDPARPGWSAPQPVSVAGSATRGLRVAVLLDAGCRSSCETLALLLRAGGARLVGESTGGTSGGPIDVTLPRSGARVEVPAFIMLDAAGQPIEGRGVVPDEPLAASAQDIAARRDPVLERGLAWAAGKP